MAKNIATKTNKAASNPSVQAIVFLVSGNMVTPFDRCSGNKIKGPEPVFHGL